MYQKENRSLYKDSRELIERSRVDLWVAYRDFIVSFLLVGAMAIFAVYFVATR